MKTIIWDYNGTIIDDFRITFDVANEMLRRRNLASYPVSEQYYLDNFTFPAINFYYKVGYTFLDETYEEVSQEFNDLYDENFYKVTLMDDFIPTIEKLIAKGYRNVIISASRQDKLDAQCELLGITKYFDDIIGSNNIFGASKTERALKWLKDSNTDSSECIYLGDSTHDLDTAIALNVKECILIARGHQSYEVLKKAHDNVLHSLSELNI